VKLENAKHVDSELRGQAVSLSGAHHRCDHPKGPAMVAQVLEDAPVADYDLVTRRSISKECAREKDGD